MFFPYGLLGTHSSSGLPGPDPGPPSRQVRDGTDLETFSMMTKGCSELELDGLLEAPIYSNLQRLRRYRSEVLFGGEGNTQRWSPNMDINVNITMDPAFFDGKTHDFDGHVHYHVCLLEG